jgi:hypothetical protein
MWRRATLWVAGLAGITVCAALAEETTHIANPDAPQGSFVCYLDDDPPTAQAAAGRVLRLLELLGVHDPEQPKLLPAPIGTETDLTSGYQAQGNRDTREQGLAAATKPSESPANSASPVASPVASRARPVATIVCPEGMTSSRRTIPLAADRTNATQAPTAELAAANKTPATPPATAVTPPPAAAAATPAAGATRVPAIFYPKPQSAKSMASLPPLPPLRAGSISLQTPASRNEVSGKKIVSSQPMPAPAPSVRSANTDAGIDSTAETRGTTPLSADSDGSFFEPRSADAVLEPQAVPIAKTPLANKHGADSGLTKISANVELTRMVMPSLNRRSVLRPSPELPPQRVAASWRKSSSLRGGAARWAMLPQLPNPLRDLPKAPAADLPRQIARQSTPESAPLSPLLSPSLPPSPSPLLSPSLPPSLSARQPQPQLPPKLRPLDPPRSEALAAAPEPALVHVAVRESRLLRTSDNVVRVVSEHEGVCDVLVFNPREIAVIGKQQGTVKVEFWYDGQGTRRASYLVAVADGRNPETRLEVDDQKIERLVAYLFPASRVELVRDRGRLIVRGSAVSQCQAVEIISTVRRSQLIPVADEIVVQPEAK